jgi:hypothetical protein
MQLMLMVPNSDSGHEMWVSSLVLSAAWLYSLREVKRSISM